MTTGAIQVFLRARIYHSFSHGMEVALFRILVTGQAQFHDIRRAQELLVITRVRIMAIRAIFKSRLVLNRTGEFLGVMARQALLDAILLLQTFAESDVGTVARHASILGLKSRMNHRFGKQGDYFGMASCTQLFSGGDKLSRARAHVALVALARYERLVALRKEQTLLPLLTDMRRMAILAIRIRDIKSLVRRRDDRPGQIVALAAEVFLSSDKQRLVRTGMCLVAGQAVTRFHGAVHGAFTKLLLERLVTLKAETRLWFDQQIGVG